MILTFLVRNQTISYIDTKVTPRIGSSNYLQLKFNFATKDWSSLRKTLHISAGEYSEPFILESNIFDVPTYYTQQESFKITLLGDNESEGTVVPTNVLVVSLDESNSLWTAEPPDPQNSAYIELLNSIGNLNDLDTEAKDNLVAAINEVKQTTDGKQDKLIAGENITIAADGKTISAAAGGGGISATARNLLLTILRAAFYSSDQTSNIAALEAVLASSGSTGGGGSIGGDTGGDETTNTILAIENDAYAVQRNTVLCIIPGGDADVAADGDTLSIGGGVLVHNQTNTLMIY